MKTTSAKKFKGITYEALKEKHEVNHNDNDNTVASAVNERMDRL